MKSGCSPCRQVPHFALRSPSPGAVRSVARRRWPAAVTVAVAGATVLAAVAPLALAGPQRPARLAQVVPNQLVAQEGGAIRVMRTGGGAIWMGVGPRLVAVEASRSSLRGIGRSPVLGGSVSDLAIGSMEPNASGGSPGVAWALVAGGRLVGLDVLDPAQPALLGSVDLLTDCTGLAVVGHHVWVGTVQGDLVGYDVTDPRVPVPSGRIDHLAAPRGTMRLGAVAGHVVVATSGTEPTTHVYVVDVRDASRPTQAAAVTAPARRLSQMYVSGGYAWILGDGLLAIDLRDPLSPAVVSKLEVDGFLLTVSLGRAYVTDGDRTHNFYWTTVVDASDPRQPVVLGTQGLAEGPDGMPRFSDPTGGMIAPAEQVQSGTGHDGPQRFNRLWYGTKDGHLLALDASDPAAGLPVVADVQEVGVATDLAVSGTLGLISLEEAVLTVDLASPESPRPLTTTLVHSYPRDVALSGRSGLVATCGQMDTFPGALYTLWLDDPAAPRLLARSFRDRDTYAVAVSGALGVLIDGSLVGYGLSTLAMSDRAVPTRVAEMAIDRGGQAVALHGTLAYVASPDPFTREPSPSALVVVDVSDPARPIARSSIELGAAERDWALHLATDHDLIYVVATTPSSSTLYVVNASDPDRPVVAARLPLADRRSGVRFAAGYVFVPGAGGALVVDVRDARRPGVVGVLPTGGDDARDVAVEGGLVYVTAGDGGLYVFRPELEGWPAGRPTPAPTTTPPPTQPPATATNSGGPWPTPAAGSPTPTAAPTPGAECICRGLARLVPPAVIADAVANPSTVTGWRQPQNPNRPAGPDNPLRTCLSLDRMSAPYHPLWNSLAWKVGCQ